MGFHENGTGLLGPSRDRILGIRVIPGSHGGHMDVESRAIYRIETFGGLAITGGTSPPTGAATQRKTMLLLAVLAASGEQGISREKLLGLFWPDSDTERARNALKQALHILRRDLREHRRPLDQRSKRDPIAESVQRGQDTHGRPPPSSAQSGHEGEA